LVAREQTDPKTGGKIAHQAQEITTLLYTYSMLMMKSIL
jgi:hypothetical protein